jgi:hypothetical protein
MTKLYTARTALRRSDLKKRSTGEGMGSAAGQGGVMTGINQLEG